MNQKFVGTPSLFTDGPYFHCNMKWWVPVFVLGALFLISEGKDVHDEDKKDLTDSSYEDLQGFIDDIPLQFKHGDKPRPIDFYRQELSKLENQDKTINY